jgi:hypothetical protein
MNDSTTYVVHSGAVDGLGSVLQSTLVVDVVHDAGRKLRVMEAVI